MYKKIIAVFMIFAFLLCQNCFATTAYANLLNYPPSVVQLSQKQNLKIFIQDELNTEDLTQGDEIIAVVSQNKYIESIRFDAGSVVRGKVESVRAATDDEDAYLVLKYRTIETPNGQKYNIDSEKIEIKTEKRLIKNGIVKKIVVFSGATICAAAGALVGAAVGMIGGAIAGYTVSEAFDDDEDDYNNSYNTKNSNDIGDTIGAIVFIGMTISGAVIGLVGGAAKGVDLVYDKAKNIVGQDFVIPENTELEIVLLNEIELASN